jgi:ribosomal protein S18 acetylase RimI-like enzyme
MIAIDDWRLAGAAHVAEAVDREASAWRQDLGWDVREAWMAIEPARQSGRLSGFVARDAGRRLAGWTCLLQHQGTLQVALLSADTPAVTAALVDAVLSSPQAETAAMHAVCVRDAAPGVREVLAAQGFDVVTYRYLSAKARSFPSAGIQARTWRADDLDPVVQLLRRAYPDRTEVRAFAPRGSEDEWSDYVAGLVAGPGCGRMAPSASFVAPGAGGRLDAAILCTALGPGTGHIAQVAVDPSARGRGMGTALVQQAVHALAARAFTDVTLLVSDANPRAARIYARLGFRDRSAFVVAVNRQPRRLTSVALATGGASTRR